jgi:diphthamide synthase (EF-2-diphthine--ammonia ligase)
LRILENTESTSQCYRYASCLSTLEKDTSRLIREFLDLGFKTIVTCVNGSYLDKGFAGRMIDHDFIKDLPENVDPCGENGEFHTFTFDGPIFKPCCF